MTCVITGCAAINKGLIVGGDLHKVGDCFVFNACFDPKTKEVAWGNSHYTKVIDFSAAQHYFERRAVIVVPAAECTLNPEAEAYIAKGAL